MEHPQTAPATTESSGCDWSPRRAKSPLALRGTKHAITYARDHSVADGLDQIATWNGGQLVSADLTEAVSAFMEKRQGVYRD